MGHLGRGFVLAAMRRQRSHGSIVSEGGQIYNRAKQRRTISVNDYNTNVMFLTLLEFADRFYNFSGEEHRGVSLVPK